MLSAVFLPRAVAMNRTSIYRTCPSAKAAVPAPVHLDARPKRSDPDVTVAAVSEGTEAAVTDDAPRRRRRVAWGSVRQLRTGQWQARLPPSVDPSRRAIEGGPFRSRRDAERALRRAEQRWEAGQTPDLAAASRTLTVDEAVGRYVDSRVPDRTAPNPALGRNTIRDYDYLRSVINHVEYGIGGKPLRGRGALVHSDVQRWVASVVASGPKARTRATKALRLLKAALRAAQRDHLIETNPADGVQLPGRGRAQATKAHFLCTGREIVDVALAARDVADHPLAVEVLLWGGLRSEEVRALQARDVRQRRKELRVERAVVESDGISLEDTKSTQTRYVRLPERLINALADYVEQHGLSGDALLFERRSGRAPYILTGAELLLRSWHPATGAAGVVAEPGAESPGRRERPTPRDGRATHASWLHALGWGDMEAMAQLGHSTITLTKDLYAEAQQADRDHDADASRLGRDADLPPGDRLDLLYEAWWHRYACVDAPGWLEWLDEQR